MPQPPTRKQELDEDVPDEPEANAEPEAPNHPLTSRATRSRPLPEEDGEKAP